MKYLSLIICSLFATMTIAQVTWVKSTHNLVMSKTLNPYEGIAIGSPSIINDNDTLKMLYAAGGIDSKGRISYAYSLDGITWNKPNDAIPIFDVSSEGQWDSHFLDTPDWLKDSTGYKLYYFGDNDNNSIGGAIGLATSTNGIHWTRIGSSPVLSPGDSTAWDGLYIESPSILYDGNKYFMWYSGIDKNYKVGIGVATSTDGRNWIKYSGNPVIKSDLNYEWDGFSVATPTVIKKDNHFEMWYCGGSYYDILDNNQLDTIKIGYATSSDGLVWEKYDQNPVMSTFDPPYTDIEWRGPWTPDVLFTNDTYYLWYETAYGFGLATSILTPLIAPSTHKNLDLAIYPNPTSNEITLEINEQENTLVKIYNLQGICVTEITGKGVIPIDVSFLPSGIYLVTAFTNNSSFVTKKFIKQ